MLNEMTIHNTQVPAMPKEVRTGCIERPRRYPVIDAKRAGKMINEVIGAIKDTRMDTKRAISADIAATARAQNQNDRLMTTYENELRRKGLSEGRRKEILDEMNKIAAASADASTESRAFQSEQLDRTHKLSRRIIRDLIVFIGGGIVYTAWAARKT